MVTRTFLEERMAKKRHRGDTVWGLLRVCTGVGCQWEIRWERKVGPGGEELRRSANRTNLAFA